MKKTMITAGIIVAAVCSGCVRTDDDRNVDGAWTYHGNEVTTKVVEIENHRYILMDGYDSGGIVHAESCPCRAR